ncbi:MAG: FtsX-like permease family protein [Candidatus Latescibacteria bacterium]|nr:FtsX-like permease family protein [Candidatus Latescibacterota bacterium]
MFRSYLTTAIRNLSKRKGYTFLNVLGLAIGMACCTVIALFVVDELSYDRYHRNSGEIYRLIDGQSAETAPALMWALKKDYPEVREYVRLRPPAGVWMMRYGDKVFFEHRVFWTDASLFRVFSFVLAQGSPETALVAPKTVVITQTVARRYFGSEDPMGKTIVADDGFADLTVTGVMEDIPANTHFQGDFFVSMSTQEAVWQDGRVGSWSDSQYHSYVLLEPGVSVSDLVAKLPDFIEKYVPAVKRTWRGPFDLDLQAVTDIHLYSDLEDELGPNGDMDYLFTMGGIGLFALLVACINFVNLSTARAVDRGREVGMRKVLGANWSQLGSQFLGESVMLAFLAMILSFLISGISLTWFGSLTGKVLSFDVLFSPYGLVCVLGSALLVGVLSGTYPAIVLASMRPVSVLSGGNTGTGNSLLRRGLVIVQFGVSVLLLIGTGITFRQLNFLQERHLGFDKENVITSPMGTVSGLEEGVQIFTDRIRNHPGVVSMSRSMSMPGRSGGQGILGSSPTTVKKLDMVPVDLERLWVDFDYLETLGLELIAGRDFVY